MKVAKIKKDNREKDKKAVNSNETYSMKSMIKILLILVCIFVVFYFITTLLVKNKQTEEDSNNIVEIDSSKITLNNLLNRKEEEYYVLVTKESLYEIDGYINTNYTSIYNSYISDYSSKDGALAFYTVDLDDALNKKYVSDNLNISDDLESLELNDEVLFKIKNGKIKSYYVGNSKIIEKLSSI